VNVDAELKIILCSVDRASLHNLVNETNLVHSFCLCILSILFITSTCFRPIQVHHQEEQLYLCDTWYLLFCTADCLVCRMNSILHTRQSAIQTNKYQVSHKYSCSSWWWTWIGLKHVEVINKIDKIHRQKLCTKLVSFTRLNIMFRSSWMPALLYEF